MPYPTKTNRFAVQFTDLADAIQEDPTRVIRVKCKTKVAAMKFRLQFYGFRNAARKGEDIKDYPQLDAIEVIIEPDFTVRFQLKDYTEMALALEEALKESGIASSAYHPENKE